MERIASQKTAHYGQVLVVTELVERGIHCNLLNSSPTEPVYFTGTLTAEPSNIRPGELHQPSLHLHDELGSRLSRARLQRADFYELKSLTTMSKSPVTMNNFLCIFHSFKVGPSVLQHLNDGIVNSSLWATIIIFVLFVYPGNYPCLSLNKHIPLLR